jgi:flagellar FliL protein
MSADNAAAAADAKAPKSKKKLILLIVAGLVLAGSSAGAAWFMAQRGKPADAKAHVAEKKPAHKPVFTPLEVFTVNLQDAHGERYAQIGMTLQMESAAAEEQLKDRLPAVRNEILLLISSKHIDELLTNEGKRELAQQVRERAGRLLAQATGTPAAPAAPAAARAASGATTVASAAAEDPNNPVQDVLFSQFIVQ